jgi:hypothetical protein
MGRTKKTTGIMTEKEILEIMRKITALKSGESCIYHRGKTRWMEKIPDRYLKKLQDYFQSLQQRNHYYFTQRRLSDDKEAEYEYIATKSRKIR